MIFKCIHNEVDSRKLHMKFTQIEPSLDAAFTYTSLLRGKSSLFMDVFDELVKKKMYVFDEDIWYRKDKGNKKVSIKIQVLT